MPLAGGTDFFIKYYLHKLFRDNEKFAMIPESRQLLGWVMGVAVIVFKFHP